MVSLKLLGSVSLTREGRPLHGPAAQRRRLALLALLAAGSDGGVGREKLIGVLWPDTDSDQARRFLADSVYALRKALGQESILAVGDKLQLNRAVIGSDVSEFRMALRRGDWEAAVVVHEGPFLDGFYLPDAAEFEQWAELQRAELSGQYAESLERLALDAMGRGDHTRAAGWWRRLQVLDPLNSRAALGLATALEASGDRAAALRHVRSHEATIRAELGIGPDPALAAMAERLRSAVASPRASDDQTSSAGMLLPDANAVPGPPVVATPATVPARSPDTAAGETAGVPTRAPRSRKFQLARITLGALIAVVALGSAAALVRGKRGLDSRRVLVTVFENQTGDSAFDPLGRMAADWIARGLMDTENLEVVSPTWAAYSADDGQRRDGRTTAEQTGAGTLVSGAYYLSGGALRFQTQILDARRGEVLQALEPAVVPIDSGMAGVEFLRQRVAAAVAARFSGSGERREITARGQPPTYPSYVEYLDGVRLFSRFRVSDAAERFERAWALDTTFHLARLYSVLAALNVGRRARADSLVQELTLRRDRMAAFDRALLEAFQSDLVGDQNGLLRAMRKVAAMTPGSQFVVGHAVAAVAANRPREALQALQRVDPHAGLLRDNPRYWEWLTVSLHLLGDHRRELEGARQGRVLHPELHGTLVQEVRALAALGRVREVERLLEDSRSLPSLSSGSPADVMTLAAVELRAHGRTDDAKRIFDRAIVWYRARPEHEQPRLRRALARALYEAGKWEEARPVFDMLSAEQPDNVAYRGHLGTLAARRGDRQEAERISDALATPMQPYLRSAQTLWRARIAAQLGDRDRALQLLREALAQGTSHGLWLHTDADLDPLRDDRSFRELLRPSG